MLGLQRELARDVPLLGELRLIEIGARSDVGAGVLQVFVEEAAVELGGVIVVMAHIAARAAGKIDDRGEPEHLLAYPLQIPKQGLAGNGTGS